MTGPTNLGEPELPAHARGPRWLNRATLNGAVLVAAGLATLTTAGSSDALRLIGGMTLIAWALASTGSRLLRRGTPGPYASPAWVLTTLAAGVLLLALSNSELTTVVGLLVIAWGLVTLADRLTGRHRSRRGSDLAAAALLVVVGGALLLVPSSLVLAVRAVLGAAGVAAGGILIAIGLQHRTHPDIRQIDVASVRELGRDWLIRRRLPRERKEELAESLYFEEPRRSSKLASFCVMMSLATTIATFAVVQDSTAVVIGAMLVAPLMTPIMGAAAAIVNGWIGRLTASLVVVAAAAAVSIALAWVIAAWLPTVGTLATNAQITSRTSPNLIDLLIALAAGAAGSYATIDSRVSSSLSGVAIAVALVPPLAVTGITLEAGQFGDAQGAFLLFATNLVCILLAGVVVFLLTGFAELPTIPTQGVTIRRVLYTVIAGMVLVSVPLTFTSEKAFNAEERKQATEDALAKWLPAGGSLTVREVSVDGERVDVDVTGPEAPPSVEQLQRMVDRETDEQVEVRVRYAESEVFSASGSS